MGRTMFSSCSCIHYYVVPKKISARAFGNVRGGGSRGNICESLTKRLRDGKRSMLYLFTLRIRNWRDRELAVLQRPKVDVLTRDKSIRIASERNGRKTFFSKKIYITKIVYISRHIGRDKNEKNHLV